VTPAPRRTTADLVVEALRGGARTTDEIVAAIDSNPSAVGIALTRLTERGVVVRELADYEAGRSGARPYIYALVEQP
jgi:predicted transcriptional regulator